MAPQVDTVELPKLHDEPVQSELSPGDWTFPDHWSSDDIRDWLATHPEGRPQVETVTIADGGENEGPFEDAVHDALNAEADRQEDKRAKEADELKANGTPAAAMALPPGLEGVVDGTNYDPRDFFLVHLDVWQDMMSGLANEAELVEVVQAQEKDIRALRKRVNALTRGMRKVNKHWSATKTELKRVLRNHEQDRAGWTQAFGEIFDKHEEQLKGRDIFAIRLARRLRKARAGRDKRERQLNQANNTIIEQQADYIAHLEKLINPRL